MVLFWFFCLGSLDVPVGCLPFSTGNMNTWSLWHNYGWISFRARPRCRVLPCRTISFSFFYPMMLWSDFCMDVVIGIREDQPPCAALCPCFILLFCPSCLFHCPPWLCFLTCMGAMINASMVVALPWHRPGQREPPFFCLPWSSTLSFFVLGRSLLTSMMQEKKNCVRPDALAASSPAQSLFACWLLVLDVKGIEHFLLLLLLCGLSTLPFPELSSLLYDFFFLNFAQWCSTCRKLLTSLIR